MDIGNFNETELFAVTYMACAWCSLGAYAVGDDTWTCREAVARTIHGANTGIIMAMIALGTGIVVKGRPFQLLGLACSGSIGWVTKDKIKIMIAKMIAGDK